MAGLIGFALGAAVAAIAALVARQRGVADHARLEAELAEARRRTEEAEQRGGEDRAAHEAAEVRMRDTFAALSQDALRENRQDFLQDATNLLTPVKEALGQVRTHLTEVDRAREGSFRDVAARLGTLAQTQEQLREATEGLRRSLRSPNVRGKWGELHLQRLVELAGMLEHCDFEIQTRGQAVSADEARRRPDLVVHLPGGGHIVIDAKVPIEAFLRASEAKDEGLRRTALDEHAAQLKSHIRALGAKGYWRQFEPAPEFVVLFLPLEPLLSAAFERDGDLVEFAIREQVVLATPMTLFALLRAVAFGWQQHAIARNTEAIQEAGRELCERLATFVGHLDRVGDRVEQAMAAYNDAVSSFTTRLAPSVKRFQELKVPGAEGVPSLSTRDGHALETRVEYH